MQITYKDKNYEIQDYTKVKDAFKEVIESSDNDIIACRYNNEVKSLNHDINKNGTIEFITRGDSDGRVVYIRGLLYIMAKAFKEVYPEALLKVNYQLTNSMFCEIDNCQVTDEMIENIKNKMQEIANKDLPIRKVVMSREEAEKFYLENQNTHRGKLQLSSKYKETVSLYYCEDYYNYFYGSMPISTKFAKLFDLKKYQNGFLLRYPSKFKPNELGEFKESLKLLSALNEYDDIYEILDIPIVSKLNDKIRANKSKDCILVSEALHEKKIAQIADKIKTKENVRMVLIAGPSSSGKTTFAQKLGIQLRINGFKPVTISVDNYFVEREFNPKDEYGNYDFECIEAIDLELFNKHLQMLLNGEEIDVPTFDFAEGKKRYLGEKMSLKDNEILVIEGIHCLNDKLTSSIPKESKFKIYISDLTVLNIDYYNRISTTDTRLIRRIVRDHQYRGYSALHTLKMWYSVNRGEEKNIFPFQEEADCMFNSSLVYELAVLKDYAIPLLKEIDNTHKEYSEAKRLATLLEYFDSMSPDDIPNTSLLREFIGGGIFDKH